MPVVRVGIRISVFNFVHKFSQPTVWAGWIIVANGTSTRDRWADQFDVRVIKLVSYNVPSVESLLNAHVCLIGKLRFIEAKHIVNMDSEVLFEVENTIDLTNDSGRVSAPDHWNEFEGRFFNVVVGCIYSVVGPIHVVSTFSYLLSRKVFELASNQ